MGHLHAMEYASMDEDTGLMLHLQSNHYPPVTLKVLPTCKEAIEKAKAGEWDEVLTLWNGHTVTVSEIIKDLHLDAWLEVEAEEE